MRQGECTVQDNKLCESQFSVLYLCVEEDFNSLESRCKNWCGQTMSRLDAQRLQMRHLYLAVVNHLPQRKRILEHFLVVRFVIALYENCHVPEALR